MSITWDREAAAHLARRAGFGATPAELDSWVAAGLDETVDLLVNYGGVDNSALESDLQTLTSIVPPATTPVYDLSRIDGVRRWFLHRMVFTKRPLEEKMTYLWNLWWTSGISKVLGVTLMLNRLDNYTSRVGRPNENYARELVELFTLGVDNYTQTDVTEIARALTGWTIQGYTGADNYNGAKFFNNPQLHDNGTKTIL